MPLALEIVTPEARVYSDTVETVVIPTVDGEIGILPGHIPLLTQVEEGELRVARNGVTELLVIGKGFAQVQGDRVSVLAESAITEEKIDVNAVEEARKRAQAALLASSDLDPGEIERLEGVIRFAVAQLTAKSRRRN
ncbi:MAG: ATP synthase F1 subunit epsilon [Bryobacterales bacterium]|nr:ATP synthase F1 subunit epsilon [Opitutaceae bacterium]MCZ2156103.1 ATP synthase F1 subunit epsilon [Bryobacterales bacterium]